MGGEDDACAVAQRRRERLPGRAHVGGAGADEPFVRVPVADIGHIDVRGTLHAERSASGGNVAAVLLAARVGAVCRQDEPDGAPYTGVRHLSERVHEEGMPVAHPHIHGKGRALVVETLPQPGRLSLGQLGDRRHAAEELVVPGDLLHSGWGGQAVRVARSPGTGGCRRALAAHRS